MTSAYDFSDLHERIDRLEPEQAEEVRQHALRLVKPAPSRFRILRGFDGPPADLGPGRGRSSGRRSAKPEPIVDTGEGGRGGHLDHRHFRAVTPDHVPAFTLLPWVATALAAAAVNDVCRSRG
ncbi:hypothetical protein [Streptomyces sp. 3214.6]|uniref:hypothetical protein n=1 Tax=Streptomyces sp. 3214.6 TaxID=1882757 RepID=UPI0018D4E860|nr:hypothetical protein [Streptomyces sp. 3214.6]